MSALFWDFEKRLLKRSKYFKDQSPDGEGRRPVTIVTGGAEGIGFALARACGELGLDLLLVSRSAEKLYEAAGMLQGAYGVRVDTLSADLTHRGGAARVEAYLHEHRLVPHLLINNAGIGLCGPFLRHSAEDIQQLIDLNISSCTALMRLLVPDMVARRRGGVINVSSLGGMVPGPYQAAYYASKAYLNSLSEAVAHELLGSGVRVVALAPGPVATKFHERMGADRSVYVFTQNVLKAESVARSGIIWFALGRRMIVPGVMSFLNSIFIRIIPNFLLVWIMGVLLKRRGERNGTGRGG